MTREEEETMRKLYASMAPHDLLATDARLVTRPPKIKGEAEAIERHRELILDALQNWKSPND